MHGHYLTNLLPEFVLIGVGMGLSFVSVTIAALAGVPTRDAGIASGLVNTARQVGGAVGLAAVTTIATIFATHRSATESVAAGTTHGYRVAFARARRPRTRRRPADGRDARAASGARGSRRGDRRRTGGGSMTATAQIQDSVILEHDIDDLLLQARGLVLVREILAQRGASRAELDAHTAELARVRRRLAETIGASGLQPAA